MLVTIMLDDPIRILQAHIPEAVSYYMDLIRGGEPSAFTRYRKILCHDLLIQMLNRQGKTQWTEVKEYYGFMNSTVNVTDKGFFQARMKFNPEAVRVIANEYIANIYDNYDDSLKKWNGLLILAVDGSKCVVPNTKDNEAFFGKPIGNSSNQPCMALLSTLHDTLSDLKLDVLVDKCTGSERSLAARHIDYYCDNYSQKALFAFDRGYPSIRLIDQIITREQYFLFRVQDDLYKSYFNQVDVGEDKELEMTFDRVSTNEYRNDRRFRQYLMNTTFKVRFAKVVIGTDADGNAIVERLMTNLPAENFTADDLKNCYWKRWGIESSYGRVKNRMKLEEFSGYKPQLILQDFYADTWMYNLVSLKIMYANEQKPVEQGDGRYTIKRNFNKTLGVMKHLLLKALMAESDAERDQAMRAIDTNIEASLIWVKDGERKFERKAPVNKSDISYRKTY